MRFEENKMAGQEGRKDEPKTERLEVFDAPSKEDSNLSPDDGEVLVRNAEDDEDHVRKIRSELARGADSVSEPKKISPEPFEGSSFYVPVRQKETGKFSLRKILRKYVTLGLIALGLAQGGKLQAEGTNDDKAVGNAESGSVPHFKAPDQTKSANVFVYGEQKVWQPKTPEQKEMARQARERLARQAKQASQAPASASTSTPTPAVPESVPAGPKMTQNQPKDASRSLIYGPSEASYYPPASVDYYQNAPGHFPSRGVRQGGPIYEERYVNPDGSVSVVRHGPPRKHKK